MRPVDLGPGYPAFLLQGRERLPLLRERRWSRVYGTERNQTIVSRLRDGSASISLGELASTWPDWTADDRQDFAYNCSWLAGQPDFPDILRYIARNGEAQDWGGVAQSIARHLPTEEAFGFLESMVLSMDPGERSNVFQAIALANHARSVAVLAAQLDALLETPDLWNDDPFLNWIAYDAACAVEFLLRLGEPPTKYESLVRRLAAHTCTRNAESVRRRFHSIYSGLENE